MDNSYKALIKIIMGSVVQFAVIIGFILLIIKVVLMCSKVDKITKKQEEIYTELNQIKTLLIKKNTDKGN